MFEDGISTAAVAPFRRAGRVHVALRRWDDAGTVDGLAVPRLDEFAPPLHVLGHPAPAG